MRSMVVAVLGWLLLGAGAANAEDSDFQIPATQLILAVQAAVRADDKAWFVSHLHYPVIPCAITASRSTRSARRIGS